VKIPLVPMLFLRKFSDKNKIFCQAQIWGGQLPPPPFMMPLVTVHCGKVWQIA